MKKGWLLFFGILFLVILEIGKVYFIMPFPGSQKANTIALAYFLHHQIIWLRIIGLLVVAKAFIHFAFKGNIWQKILLLLSVLLYGTIFYFFNCRFLADKIFYPPTKKEFVTAEKDTTQNNKLVIGVNLNGQAKAYPIEIIGYHHQVADSIHNQPFIVTYCTVCRTGRVFSPMVDGKNEQFRLVGMDHFNAMFEDATTKSWWQQATGKAIAGKLKGYQLIELPSIQMPLGEWKKAYPLSTILQPDTTFKKHYKDLKGYDDGTIKGKLEHRDSLSWHFKSWVIGIQVQQAARAYDWNELKSNKLEEDVLSNTPVLLTLKPDNVTFAVISRKYKEEVLHFTLIEQGNFMVDVNSHSKWQLNGYCVDGPLKGTQLNNIQCYQEFWHSWLQFHPGTTKYSLKK